MSFNDLFDSGIHKRNLSHFAAIANLASVDGEINQEEQQMLEIFAQKLDIDETEFKTVLANPEKFPINPPENKEKRLERIYDLFRIIYSDHTIDEDEAKLLYRYAIGLGFSEAHAKEIIKKSDKIFGGRIDYEDYVYLLTK